MVGGINNNYMMNAFFSNPIGGSGVSSPYQIYDYKSAQRETKSMLEAYNKGKKEVNTLKADTADFLNKYTAGMKTQSDAASKLMGDNLQELLFDAEGGVTEETIQVTVDATQKMVDAHNANIKLLNDNADRGPGVSKQLARMVDDPASKSTMEMLGLSMNKDGTMSLDAERLKESLSTETPGQLDLYKDILGGAFGVASHLQGDASAGMRASASSLVNNDIAKMQSIQEETSFKGNSEFSSYLSYSRMGAYTITNMGAIGMLMNFTT